MNNPNERLVRRLRQHALPDPHDERPVMYADLFAESADSIERLRDAVNVALGHMTGGMDGDWRDCDPVDLLRKALDA